MRRRPSNSAEQDDDDSSPTEDSRETEGERRKLELKSPKSPLSKSPQELDRRKPADRCVTAGTRSIGTTNTSWRLSQSGNGLLEKNLQAVIPLARDITSDKMG